MKSVRTWILIADASRARVLLHSGPGSRLEPVAGMATTVEHRKASEIGSDRPGRSYESHGMARHAVEPRSDPERIEEQRFAARLLARLETEADTKRFDRLVIVAPPTMLGDLRQALSPRLANLVVATLDKDLTKTADNKLASHLADVLPL
jgi:protein required for attachment to host cells